MSWLTDLGLFYCAAVWGATFYMVKDVLGTVHPVTLVAYRFLLSALLMLPWALRRKNLWSQARESGVLAFFLTLLYLSQTVGLKFTAASNSGFITGLFILFVPAFLLFFFKRSPAPNEWRAVGVALPGLWLLTGGSQGINRGDLLTLVSAMTYAAHLLATDTYVKRKTDPVLLAFHQFWMTGLICLVLSAIAGCPLQVNSPKAIGVILFLTLFPTLSAFFIQMLAQRHAPPLRVSLIFSLEPVFAALFAWTLGGETFRWASALGGGLIVAAMVISKGPTSK